MKAVIIANGDIRDYEFVRQILADFVGYDYVLACDGGLRHCHVLGVVPDHIVGDLDSAPQDILEKYRDVPLLQFSPEKDQTDLELAITFSCDKGADSITILGGLGGRFDHQLANVHVLVQAVERHVKAELRDEHTRIRLINDCCKIKLHKQDGALVTLLPFTNAAEGIETEGLQYPLKSERLSIGFARGVSNQIIDEWAAVSLKKGMLLVIQTNEL